ncbi:hypothetical protein C1Y30_02575 [Pseudomonas sp. GW704-F3]|nr:hypothetical protein C1Y30_02575 [Pseudomonas sp. GW704-F3]PMU96335.1 hypothetical protein C1Y28_07610 [Pseudomonas sp. GW704-F5]PMV06400.1 hypothetical protein C1Y29_07020 [Pseudomonas sp. MPBD4-3]PMV33027.1 hypothetical protein C1Y27_12275 [Pseudomonas sp. GW704-F2]
MRLPAYSASAKVICFIEKLGDWCPGILPNQEVFFRISLALCCRADFITGNAKVTYEELIRLTGLSRPTVAKALTRLEVEGLIQRKAQALRKGSSILICGWLESKSWAKIPKRWLYDGSSGAKILMLTEFNFSRASLSALKVYLALLAYRD